MRLEEMMEKLARVWPFIFVAIYFLIFPPGWLKDLTSPGVALIWAVVAVLAALALAADAAENRSKQAWPWRASPYLVALPLTALIWLVREPLTRWAGSATAVRTVVVLLMVVLGMRGLSEIGIATAVVGGFLAPDSTILLWCAVPLLSALLFTLMLDGVEESNHEDARKALGLGQARRARRLVWLTVPLTFLRRGANRAIVSSFVGTVYEQTGDSERAGPWKVRAARISRRRGRVPDHISALHDLAGVQRSLGRNQAAIDTITLAKRINRDRLAAYLKRVNTAIGTDGIAAVVDADLLRLVVVEGGARRDMGDVQGAIDCADATFALVDAVPNGRNDPAKLGFQDRAVRQGIADLLHFKAGVLSTLLHEENQAMALYGQAEAIARDLNDNGRLFMYLYNQATSQVRRKRYADARQTLDEAKAIVDSNAIQLFGAERERPGGYVNPMASNRIMLLGGMANIARLQGRLDESARLYQEALVVKSGPVHRSVGLNALIGYGALQLERGKRAEAIELLLEGIKRGEALRNQSFLRPAYLHAGKAYERDGTEADLAEACRYYQRTIELLERTRASISGEGTRLQFVASTQRMEPYERMVLASTKLRQTVDAFEYAERGKARAMLERLAAPDSLASVPLLYPEARQLVTTHPRVVMIEYFTSADGIAVLGVLPEKERPEGVVLPIDRPSVRRFVQANFGGAGQVRDLLASGLDQLWHAYDPLVAPLAEWADPGDHVVFIPHGPLHYLPLHVLRVSGSYAIERNSISYAPSASVLRACVSAGGGTKRRKAHVFGDPTDDLPYARTEASEVARLLKTNPSLGKAVTKLQFRKNAENADLLHYAGHARFDQADPMSSALTLATGETIQAREIAELKMRAELVTLSGCETGVSWDHPGDEIIGLTRGFLYAGVPATVASLWRVPDESTAHLMTAFYESISKGVTKAQSLQAAILSTYGHDRWTSWYHWAPFVLVGDWH